MENLFEVLFNIFEKNYMSSNTKENININIVLPAWKLIHTDSKAKKFYVIPGILSTIFLSAVLTYQTIYTYVVIFGKTERDLQIILHFFESFFNVWILLWVIIFVIIYFLSNPIFEAWLIKYIDLRNKGKNISKSEAFGQGVYKFLPMFEYNNFFSEFKLLSILNFYLFTIRFIWMEYINIINLLYCIIFFVWIFINIMFIYAKYFIILENKTIFASIWESAKLTILSLKKTIYLFFMMFALNLRVIINFIVFLAFPIFIAIAISVISTKILLFITIAIISAIFLFLILFVWYLTAVLDILKIGVWYYAYEDGKDLLETE